MSSISLVSSPMTCMAPPQQGQLLSSTSTRTSTRGRCAGRAPRLRRREPGAAEGCRSLPPPPPAPPRRRPRPARGPPGRAAAGRGRASPSAGRTGRAAAAGSAAAASRSRPGPRRARTRTVSRSIRSARDRQRSAGRRLPPSAAAATAADQDLARDHPAPATWRDSTGRQAGRPALSAHQAVLGRRTGRGWSRCHGKPSSRVASCAPVSRTTPSAGEGQQNRPASSLFAYRTRPVPS